MVWVGESEVNCSSYHGRVPRKSPSSLATNGHHKRLIGLKVDAVGMRVSVSCLSLFPLPGQHNRPMVIDIPRVSPVALCL